MFYTTYKITNNIDGRIYVGVHKTENIHDSYMGSSKTLKSDILKYGIENFTKEILFIFDNPEEMYLKEVEIVNEEFVANNNTYNLKPGGQGCWDYINNNVEARILKNKKARKTTNDRYPNLLKEWSKKGGRTAYELHGTPKEFLAAGKISFLGKNHTDDAKKLIGKANSIHQIGKGNSQYGTMWITNGIENKKIKKDAPILDGWVKGRKC